jgi:hypothetical protein
MGDKQPPKELLQALSAMLINNEANTSAPKDTYEFWGTQPVAQFNDDGSAIEVCSAP